MNGLQLGCLEAFQGELSFVRGALRRAGASPADVQDLSQDLFLALLQSWRRYDAGRPLRPYLFRIVSRVGAAHQRKRRRETVMRDLDSVDAAPGPEGLLQSKQARAVLLAALEQIPALRRTVLVMHELDEIPMTEVAAALSIPLFTAYSRLRKARAELKAAVQRVLAASSARTGNA
jgi:RNA polymerase sigma-70 factor (ECF subfamily)